jgi:hypothetical protein
MEAKADGSLCFDQTESKELRQIITRIYHMLDEIPAMAAPSIRHRDIDLITAWHEKLQVKKQARKKREEA